MAQGTKYIALGVLIGISGTALLAAGALFLASSTPAEVPATDTAILTLAYSAASITPSSSSAPTFTPTFTPVPTLDTLQSHPTAAVLLPTDTPDPILATINSGGLIFTGPLSNAEQVALYRSSLNYARTSAADSRRLAKQINGVGYGDPTNICGPLAIAILQGAGLLTKDITPHDFWLLNPLAPTDKRILGKAFPPDIYAYSKIQIPLNKMDWQTSPLAPGDFLFIWHGSGGNFDHMLVVSRVDSSLRAYAVTNFGTSSGYVIAEALLYDPGDPHSGLFFTWTKEREAILGSTGFGGYELWRRRGP